MIFQPDRQQPRVRCAYPGYTWRPKLAPCFGGNPDPNQRAANVNNHSGGLTPQSQEQTLTP